MFHVRNLFNLVIAVSLGSILVGCDHQPKTSAQSTPVLRVLCGNSMSSPIQELGRRFAPAHNLKLEYDLGGSETLLPKILAGAAADIFVCHDPFEQKLKAAGQWTATVAVGHLEPVLAVRPGNPKKIQTLQDLTRPGLQIGIGDPRYSTCGELFVAAIKAQGLYDGVMTNVVMQGRTHAEIANGLIVGPLDAVVVWNFVVPLHQGKLEIVRTGIQYPETRVTILGLKASPHPAARDAFLDFCRQPLAKETFQRYGYRRSGG